MSLPRFLVPPDTLHGRTATVTGAELHHLRVRRLQPGSRVALFDGAGKQRLGVVVALDRHHAEIQLDEDTALADSESPLHLVLAQAVLPARPFDLVIEKATELGVSEILTFTSERSLQPGAAARVERWNRVAAGAAKQCQRRTVPCVHAPVSLDRLFDAHRDGLRLFFWERAAGGRLPALAAARPEAGRVLAVVGPEGGFTEPESARAASAGFDIIGLGPRVLRAETAAIVALTLCQYLWGDLGRVQDLVGPGV